jgi:hypothetical protein
MTAPLIDRTIAAVAAELDKVRAKYLAYCGDAEPSSEVLAALGRLKDSSSMHWAFREITKRSGQGGFLYPVVYGELRDDKRKEWYIAKFDQIDQELAKKGLPLQSEWERRRVLEHLDSLPPVGGEEGAIIQAAVMLVGRAASLVLRSLPDDDQQTLITEAIGLLEAQRKIRDFLLTDRGVIYDVSVIETLNLIIIPALERNLAAKKTPIYAEIRSKNRKKPLAHLQGAVVVLHKLVQELFGADVHLYSTIANILCAMTGKDDIDDRDVQSLIASGRRNAQKTLPKIA